MAEALHEWGVIFVSEGGVDEALFSLLETDDFFFDGSCGDHFVDGGGLGLADAVGAVSGLGFYGWVPPWVEVNDGVSGCEVEAVAAGFEGDEEGVWASGGLESFYFFGAVFGGAI